jgi:hypothetical protein
MGFDLVSTPTAGAPQGVEAGLCPARFDGLSQQSHPDWAGKGKFGMDDGERIHWAFTLTDDSGAVLYDEGDPIEVEAVNGTNLNTKSDKSRNALWLKNLSPAAFAAVDAGQPFDADTLIGIPCMLLLSIKDNGWPKVENVLPARKAR